MSALRAQLVTVRSGTHSEYQAKVHELERQRDYRLFVAKTFHDYELSNTKEEFEREKAAALQQYESKKAELKDCLLHELQDKRRAYDNYRNTVELGAAGTTIAHHAYLHYIRHSHSGFH